MKNQAVSAMKEKYSVAIDTSSRISPLYFAAVLHNNQSVAERWLDHLKNDPVRVPKVAAVPPGQRLR